MTSTIEETRGYENKDIRLTLYCFVLLASGIWLLYRRLWNTRLSELGNKIPGPKPLPIFGNALMVIGKSPSELVSFGLKLQKKYGNVARAWLGPDLYIFLADPEDIEIILDSPAHIQKADEYRFFEPWLGEGLLISKGAKWQTHRKIIAPTFHHHILKSFIGVFNENSKAVVEKMRPEIGKTFDVHEYMGGVTVDILLETAMGISKTTQDESSTGYAVAVLKMCDILQKRHVLFYLRPDIIFKMTSLNNIQTKLLNIIHGLTKKVIKNKKEIYLQNKAKGIMPRSLDEITRSVDDSERLLANDEKTLSDTVFKGYRDDLDQNDENDVGEKKRLAFLDLLLESSQNGTNKLTDHEIKEEVDTIMFEGHDTTAAGSSFVLCLLGVHKHIQEKVYDELYEIFGDSDRPVSFADTLHMKYLERVILESLRMYPPVPIIARKINQDVKIASNYIIPAGSTVGIGIYHVHRNPKYWKNPDVFDPDNFLPENTQNRHYYSFIPFSAGPRSCVGRKYALLKLKVLLATILRNYKMVSNVTEDQYVLQADIILKRTDGFRVKIEPRNRIPSTA